MSASLAHAPIRFHALDGLRAVAVSLVLAHHLGGAALGSGWFGRFMNSMTSAGVELFFVLSAVVLGRHYIRDRRAFDVSQYAQRRVQRLWPPFIVAWLLAGLVIALTTLLPTWWSESANLPSFEVGDWLAQLFIVNGWVAEYNFAWWSLTIEVIFYALLPALLIAFRFAHPRPIVGAAVFLGTLVVSFLCFDRVKIPVVGALLAYASCFVSGLILATYDLPKVLRNVAIIVGASIVAAWLVWPSINPHVGWSLVYLGVVAWALKRESRMSSFLSHRLFVWLGERSYSIFLTHYSVIALVCWGASLVLSSKGGTYFLVTRALSLPLSLFVAMLVFHFIERRFAKGLITAGEFLPFSRKPRYGALAAQTAE